MRGSENDSPLSLAAQAAISDVVLRYGTSIDRRDWALFETCFTLDLETNYGEIGSWKDRETFVRRMEAGHLHYGKTLHRLTNLVISGQGRSRAVVTSYIDAILMPLDIKGTVRRAYGIYHDDFIVHAKNWLIKSRKFELVFMTDQDLSRSPVL